MNCHDVRAVFSDLLDGMLPSEEAAAVRAHLAECAACREEFRELEGVVRLVRSVPQEPPGDLAERVMAGVREESALARRRRFLALSGGAAGALAAGLLLLVLVQPSAVQKNIENETLETAAAPPSDSKGKARMDAPAPTSVAESVEAQEPAEDRDEFSGRKARSVSVFPAEKKASDPAVFPEIAEQDLAYLRAELLAWASPAQDERADKVANEQMGQVVAPPPAREEISSSPLSAQCVFVVAETAESRDGFLASFEAPKPQAPAGPVVTGEGARRLETDFRSKDLAKRSVPSGAKLLRVSVPASRLAELRKRWAADARLKVKEMPASALLVAKLEGEGRAEAPVAAKPAPQEQEKERLVELVILLYEPAPPSGK